MSMREPATKDFIEGLLIGWLIGIGSICLVLFLAPRAAKADDCTLPGIVTCGVPLNGAPGCNPDAPVITCMRYDGTIYSVPMFAPPYVSPPMPRLVSPNPTARMPGRPR